MAVSTNDINKFLFEKIGSPLDISKPTDFELFIGKSELFMLSLEKDKVQCHSLEDNDQEFSRVHMKNVRSSIFGSPTKQKPIRDDYSFADVINHFNDTLPKKKVFAKHKDYYVVKKYFTQGVQFVKEGEQHIYMVFQKPLDFYILKKEEKLTTFRSSLYQRDDMQRAQPGDVKMLPPNTYYIVVAPCHTVFVKVEATESGHLLSVPVAENESTPPQSQQTKPKKKTEKLSKHNGPSTSQQPSTSGQNSLKCSTESKKIDGSEMKNATSNRRSSSESDRSAKRAKTMAVMPSSHSFGKEEISSAIHLLLNHVNSSTEHPAVFAVRKDCDIESYALSPGSTFDVLPGDLVTGSFAIENEDMDPHRLDYLAAGHVIMELAAFKNGASFETVLTVQKDLLDELRNTERRKEKLVVNYFFESTFKAVEATYKKFCEMRNTKMIGSCVPAIVPLCNAKYSGAVSDAYEARY